MIVPTRFPTRPLAALVALISVGLLGASASASAATRAPHAPHPPHAAGTSQASHPSLRQLTGTLGVLRRPQTQTDRAPQLITELDQQSHSTIDLGLFGRPVASLARLATTAPWGQKIYLVPMLPPTQAAISKLPSNVKGAARNSTAGIEFYSSPLGRGAPYPTAPDIKAGKVFDSSGHGRYVMLLPDGVKRIEVWPSGKPQSQPIKTAVKSNVATFVSSVNGWQPGREIWSGHPVTRSSGCGTHRPVGTGSTAATRCGPLRSEPRGATRPRQQQRPQRTRHPAPPAPRTQQARPATPRSRRPAARSQAARSGSVRGPSPSR